MDIAQLLLMLKARWKVIAAMVALGALAGVIWIASSQKSYLASAQLLLSIRAPDTVGPDTLTPQLTPDYLTTQADIIQSDRVVNTVVRETGLDKDPTTLAAYRDAAGSAGTLEQYLAGLVRGGLSVAPSTTSRVMAINYVSNDPAKSAMLANAFAEAYQDVTLDLTIDPARRSSRYFQASADDVSKKLAEAQSTLAKRRAQLGITAQSDQADSDDARLQALSQQLATAQASQAAQQARAGNGALPDIMASPVVSGMQSELARLEAQRSQMATYAGPNNVDYMQLTSQIAAMRRQLATQEALVSRSAASSSAQSSASVASLRAAVDAQRQRVITAQASRGDLAALEQRVTNLRETYNQIMSRQAQSNLLGTASQTNVTLLSPAVPPTRTANKPAILKFGVCLFLGLILGAALAVALELLDHRLRRPDDVGAWLGIPNLGGVRQLEGPGPRMIGGAVRRYLPGPGKALPHE